MLKYFAAAAALLFLTCAAGAAELRVGKTHEVHRAVVHRWHAAHAARSHYGYYFGHWGWRPGGTATSWYGSAFVLPDALEWGGAPSVLVASPRPIAAIHCSGPRPDVCLAEPIVTPLAAGPWRRP